ncbi:MAG TPA: nucleoside-diphosphate kinase [Bacillota bacterium]|nr:nucleoside-diphosphate kinase [Bacillota bacterium]HOJ84222.1 nucleoside-diphosphate kinase [Bacillota bacterium]HOL16367.1 nucleoside-diphosphate kinase [Bacillota bacterium]HPZ12259.1 nucleoside-diphosphate kinase [Bacillota bacterium]HQE10545.1 nucleoside-diphosphate kinase [Bacillota bacterium]
MNSRERTFVMVKPDGVQRKLVGEVITRLEKKGLQPVAIKMMQMEPELAARHYGEHRGKPFYESLISFITSGPVVAMVWEGDNAVAVARSLIGATNPQEAAPGTIRGDLALFTGNNLVHGSDSLESARREIGLFFNEAELCSYRSVLDEWIYGR